MSEKEPNEDELTAASYDALSAIKAVRLKDLLKRKPGEKKYKHALKAFLEVDAALDQAARARYQSSSVAVLDASITAPTG